MIKIIMPENRYKKWQVVQYGSINKIGDVKQYYGLVIDYDTYALPTYIEYSIKPLRVSRYSWIREIQLRVIKMLVK